jgi:hypothetical protein
MANNFASIGGALAILKNYYEGPIVDQFNNEMPLYREIEKGKEKFNGLKVIRPLKLRRNTGIGATSDGGNLPKIGTDTVVQAEIEAKFNYLRFGITGPMIKASQGEKGAFISAMSHLMQSGMEDLKNDVNRQLFWTGRGDLAKVNAAVVASTALVAKGRESTEDGDKFLEVGMVIDVITSAGAVVASNVEITDMTVASGLATLTLSAAVTVSADDIIVRSGAGNKEIQGLLVALDGATSSIFGINRATYRQYQGNVVDAASAQLTLSAMKQAANLGRRRGGAKYSVVFCDFDSERYYEKLLVADKRYVGKVVGDGTFSDKGESYLEHGGSKVVPDKDCPTRFLWIDAKQWKKYVLSELEWADETGSQLIAQTSADSFEARLRLFCNLFPEKPAAQAALKSYIAP